MSARHLKTLLSLLFITTVLTGCAGSGGTAESGTLKVTVTTGMIADVVRVVGGAHVSVTALMGPGVDPHLYKASEGDISKLQNAQLIFYNGLSLEGRMADIFVKMAAKKPTVAVSEKIPEETVLQTSQGHHDPHVWFDVTLWMKAAEVIRDTLVQIDGKHKADYEKNTAAYLQELAELHDYARRTLAQVPKERRVLVTAHDAFGYFGRAYDIEVMGLQGISTDTEYGLRDVQNLVEVLSRRKIKAVFVESSVPKRSIEAVVQGAKARGQEVTIGGELFSDALGEAGKPEGTYIGMVRHNVDTIANALK